MKTSCRCEKCPHCGFKHYCNLSVDHPDGKVRAGGCPANIIDDPLRGDDDECEKCAGCGKVANDDDETPWKYWAELPIQSAVAVMVGLVRPVSCPECGGSGVRDADA